MRRSNVAQDDPIKTLGTGATGPDEPGSRFPLTQLGRSARPRLTQLRSGPQETLAALGGSEFEGAWRDEIAALELDNKELRHRLENFVPLVLSIIKLTGESAEHVSEFRETLEGRLRAIANADAITQGAGDRCTIEDLVRVELAPFCRANQFDIVGPPVKLRREVAQTFSIIVHELTTNAVKYGALSSPSGRVVVTWGVRSIDDSHASLRFEWLERGGAAVECPSRRGFGTTILCDHGRAITGGTSSLIYGVDRLHYVLNTVLETPGLI